MVGEIQKKRAPQRKKVRNLTLLDREWTGKRLTDQERLFLERPVYGVSRYEQVSYESEVEIRERIKLAGHVAKVKQMVGSQFTDFERASRRFRRATEVYRRRTLKLPPKQELTRMGDILYYVSETIRRTEEKAAAARWTREDWNRLEQEQIVAAHDELDYEEALVVLLRRQVAMRLYHELRDQGVEDPRKLMRDRLLEWTKGRLRAKGIHGTIRQHEKQIEDVIDWAMETDRTEVSRFRKRAIINGEFVISEEIAEKMRGRMAVCGKRDCDTVFVKTDGRQVYCSRDHWKLQKSDVRRLNRSGTFMPRSAYISQRENSKEKAIRDHEVRMTEELQELIDETGAMVNGYRRQEPDYRSEIEREYQKYTEINKTMPVESYTMDVREYLRQAYAVKLSRYPLTGYSELDPASAAEFELPPETSGFYKYIS